MESNEKELNLYKSKFLIGCFKLIADPDFVHTTIKIFLSKSVKDRKYFIAPLPFDPE